MVGILFQWISFKVYGWTMFIFRRKTTTTTTKQQKRKTKKKQQQQKTNKQTKKNRVVVPINLVLIREESLAALNFENQL